MNVQTKDQNIKHVNETFLLGKVCSEDIKELKSDHRSYMITFMIETTSNIFSHREEKEIETIEKHKIVCFDSLAKRIKEKIEKGDVVHVIGANRSKKIRSGDKEVLSRDVVAQHVSVIKEAKATDNINISLILGKVISDEIKIINNDLATFMVETVSETFSERFKKVKRTSERHKIVCFDPLMSEFKNKIKKDSIVHITGCNRSKKIKAGDKHVLSRDVVAKKIILIE